LVRSPARPVEQPSPLPKKGEQLSVPNESLLEFRIGQPVALPAVR